MKIRLSVFLVLGLLTSALAAPTVAASPFMSGIGQMTATSYATSGSGPTISGWYWMRAANYSDAGTWRFESFDRDVLSSTKPLRIFLTPLVTQAASGGAGWTARIRVKVTQTCGTTTRTLADRKITTTNPFPLRTTANSGGVGYQNYATTTVSKSQFKCHLGLVKVVVTRDSTYKSSGYRPHVAISSDAVQLYWYTP